MELNRDDAFILFLDLTKKAGANIESVLSLRTENLDLTSDFREIDKIPGYKIDIRKDYIVDIERTITERDIEGITVKTEISRLLEVCSSTDYIQESFKIKKGDLPVLRKMYSQ